MRSHLIEVGPNSVRRLCCGGGTVADAEAERTAFETIDDRVALFDLQPVAVASLWEDVLGSVDCGTSEHVTVVHPSWWSPARVGIVSAAARTLVGIGEIRPRSWLVAQAAPSNSELDTLLVEIADQFVVLTGAAVATETRRRDQLEVAGAVARAVLTMASDATETVVIDAPAAVHGAGTLAGVHRRKTTWLLRDERRSRRRHSNAEASWRTQVEGSATSRYRSLCICGSGSQSTGADNAGACHRIRHQCCCLAT